MNFIGTSVRKLINGISWGIPKKEKLWVFGTWDGKLYSDNSKYLFEYISENCPEIDAIWITREKNVYKEVKEKGYKCCMYNKMDGIWSALRSQAAFVTCSTHDISPFINSKKTQVFNLWHGLGVKDVKWVDKNGNLPSAKTMAYMQEYIWFGTSQYFTETLSMQYFADKSKFYVTGFPRNDVFVTRPENRVMEKFMEKYKDKKLVIYMPTHRNFGKDENPFINKEMFEEVDQYLLQNNMIMVYKPHIRELENLLPYVKNYKNIVFATDTDMWGDPYSYLYYFDGLISDYSSVASDFICSGKPVVLFPYDLEHYKNKDGGILPIFWKLPTGPSCYSWKDVIDTMRELLENDTWKERREQCREYYHQFNDGQNCKRAYEMATEILNKRK